MTERVKIFEPCYMEYEQLEKPVKYTEEFLKELASRVNKTDLVYENHNGEVIGEVTNFTVIDGVLYGDVTSDKPLDNLSYSPYIDCSTIDDGNFWIADKVNGMIDIALTTNPRKPFKLPNTGGSQMSEANTDNETIKILNKQVQELNKKLAVAENKNKANEDKLNKFTEMEKELTELREWKETNQKTLEEQKPIIEAYNKQLSKRKEELLNKISNNNEEIKAKLQNESLETLENIDSLYAHEQPPVGISTNNAQGLNEGDGSNDEETEQTARKEAVENMFGDLFTKED